MNLAEAKKAFVWHKEYSGLYIIEVLETLEKSVRETLAKYPLWPLAIRMALEKEVLGEE